MVTVTRKPANPRTGTLLPTVKPRETEQNSCWRMSLWRGEDIDPPGVTFMHRFLSGTEPRTCSMRGRQRCLNCIHSQPDVDEPTGARGRQTACPGTGPPHGLHLLSETERTPSYFCLFNGLCAQAGKWDQMGSSLNTQHLKNGMYNTEILLKYKLGPPP